MTPEQKAKELYTDHDNMFAAKRLGFLAGYQYAQEWISEKPVFKDEAVFLAATLLKGEWNYSLWRMVWTDGYNEKEEQCRYLAFCCEDGQEWGDYAELSAHKYLILTPPNKEIKPC